MKRFIEGADRTQVSLLPECIEDYVAEDNPVRVIEAFVEQLDLRQMGAARASGQWRGSGRSRSTQQLLKFARFGFGHDRHLIEYGSAGQMDAVGGVPPNRILCSSSDIGARSGA
jgi:hypothetical protein